MPSERPSRDARHQVSALAEFLDLLHFQLQKFETLSAAFVVLLLTNILGAFAAHVPSSLFSIR
jgi:hypothetical protein